MARKPWIKWTEEDMSKLLEIYYQYELSELAMIFNRTEKSIKMKYAILTRGTENKKVVELSRCPECKKLINKVEGGYFCKYCLKEFDRYGDFMAPLSANA